MSESSFEPVGDGKEVVRFNDPPFFIDNRTCAPVVSDDDIVPLSDKAEVWRLRRFLRASIFSSSSLTSRDAFPIGDAFPIAEMTWNFNGEQVSPTSWESGCS
jgi:hypothetical protein